MSGTEYWLFGGWAVDFYVGRVTREHDDVDLAVWSSDASRIAELLAASGWRHVPHPGEDGGTGYERDGVRVEFTFLTRDEGGAVVVPMRSGPAVPLIFQELGDQVRALGGVRCRVIGLDALARGKAIPREGGAAAKDRADFALLMELGTRGSQ
jgi:hypothetical protein